MSLKSISQTRWKIESDRITIYPHGLSYILSAVLLLLFGAGYIVYLKYLNYSNQSTMPLFVVLIGIVLLFIGFARTCIEFDISAGIMRKKLMGFLPVRSIPFSKIYAINPVTNIAGSYTYKVFKKDNRYGKGIVASCAYGKNDDPNAIAFIDRVVTPIHKYLEAHDVPEDFKPISIETYRFFNTEGTSYTLKKNTIGSLILGLVLSGLGIHELTPYAWMGQDLSVGRICFLLFTVIGGPLIISAGFTKVVFNKNNRLLERRSPIGLGNKTFSFDDFNGIQTVRKSTNMIYTGTDVQMYFLKPGAKKEDVIVLQSFFSTKNVERFIAELNSIIF